MSINTTVRRIICAGANYAAHVREMGGETGKILPFFFFKPTDAIVHSGATIPYPTKTENLHYEVELVVAIGKAGFKIEESQATELIYGYAVGIDMTRRDIQMALAKSGMPWEFGKAFDNSALISTIHPIAETGEITEGRIWLAVDGQIRQDSNLSDLIWSVQKLLVHLSEMIELQPGDIVYTGTPQGVGPVKIGQVMTGGIDGLTGIEVSIGPSL
jgi:fumarylpyruvate hydrolase